MSENLFWVMGFFFPITNFYVKKNVYVCFNSLKYCRVKQGLNKHNPPKTEIQKRFGNKSNGLCSNCYQFVTYPT